MKEARTLSHCESLPQPGTTCALALGEDGTIALAWEGGVCSAAPLERTAELERLLEDGTPKICHDLKTVLHELDDLGITGGGFLFDTALAAYDLNPSQTDFSISELATTFLGRSLESLEDQAVAVWQLYPILQAQLS